MNTPLDNRDWMPRDMAKYISNYGFHFDKHAFEFAVSQMRRKDANGKEVKAQMYPKEDVETVLKTAGIELQNDVLYDAAFVFNMAKADYSRSLPDDVHIALYVKETLDDVDASPETTFRRWMATMVGNGTPIPWSDFV